MKKLKGFTLIELIIVMAILAILMAAIMRMFKPIRETYVDATYNESQRTTQNGIITYISESVRYATDMGIYEGTTITDAIDAFAASYAAKYGTPAANINDIKDNVQVIVIDYETPYFFNDPTHSHPYKGRVLKRKSDGTLRVAMGAPYYGERTYDIVLSDGDTTNANWTAEDGMKIKVSSLSNRFDSANSNNYMVSVEGEVRCKNLISDHGVASPGMFNNPATGSTYSTPTHGTATNVYIVYLNGDDKSKIPT
ncbi:MAG: prepilin-type N-terminal cleavage/methylation domain-containing protein [Oscillospiraceae bacterium]|nr:prepilin-type N-terminal cleavage/methylation domain-containing protein [Oscillospiraceae bacterium]